MPCPLVSRRLLQRNRRCTRYAYAAGDLERQAVPTQIREAPGEQQSLSRGVTRNTPASVKFDATCWRPPVAPPSRVRSCAGNAGRITVLASMSRCTRKKSGVVIAALALAALPALAFAGVPLITRSSAYFVETGTTTSSVHFHWPLGVVAVSLLVGIALILSSRRASNPWMP
jgi:hypothetical protein